MGKRYLEVRGVDSAGGVVGKPADTEFRLVYDGCNVYSLQLVQPRRWWFDKVLHVQVIDEHNHVANGTATSEASIYWAAMALIREHERRGRQDMHRRYLEGLL